MTLSAIVSWPPQQSRCHGCNNKMFNNLLHGSNLKTRMLTRNLGTVRPFPQESNWGLKPERPRCCGGEIKASEMLVAPRISECFVCHGLL